jgi:predicted nuclease of predicted toxin-antitoxin system
MKFIIDAQLPRRLTQILQAAGHKAIHVIDLPDGSRTRDSFINQYSFDNGSILITKDTDFVNSFLISKRPHKLLMITTGNITNSNLVSLLDANLKRSQTVSQVLTTSS